ncbi:MAG: serine hydrolase, partial [Candidatus Obscuribacterales bacterium]|nr:serine hydrolase [Candidatus Obscuribacterales bacterium]
MRIKNKTRTSVLLGSLCLSFCLLLPALGLPEATKSELKAANLKLAAHYSAQNNGVSMLVMQNGKIIFEDYPNGSNSSKAFELASGTKSFSGVAAIAAKEDGLLELDEAVSKTISEWKKDERKSKITIRQLLSLISGIKGEVLHPTAYADAINTELSAAPGSVFQYGAAPFQI